MTHVPPYLALCGGEALVSLLALPPDLPHDAAAGDPQVGQLPPHIHVIVHQTHPHPVNTDIHLLLNPLTLACKILHFENTEWYGIHH